MPVKRFKREIPIPGDPEWGGFMERGIIDNVVDQQRLVAFLRTATSPRFGHTLETMADITEHIRNSGLSHFEALLLLSILRSLAEDDLKTMLHGADGPTVQEQVIKAMHQLGDEFRDEATRVLTELGHLRV